MKKTIFLICIFITSVGLTQAQPKKHEIVAGYGTIVHYDVKEVTVNLAVTIVSVGYVNTIYKNGSGTFFAGYRFTPDPKVTVGIEGGYHKIDQEAWSQDEFLGTLTRKYYIMAGLANFNYVRKPSFQMYSGLAFGYAFQDIHYIPIEGEEEVENPGKMAFHINAIGFRFGKSVGGFLELGYGYKGVINFGFSLKL